MSRSVTLYLGPPGTGKTKTLLDEVERAVEAGVHPKRIAYVAFTKAAAGEAKRRVINRFPNYVERDFPWFRTIHSMAYRLCGLSRERVMVDKHWKELGGILGTTFHARYEFSDWTVFDSGSLGDRCIKIHSLSIAKGIDLKEAWELADEEKLSFQTVEKFRTEFIEFKRSRGLVDFSDMLDLSAGTFARLDAEKGIVDEAQDLTHQQWTFVRAIFRDTKSIVVGGDDDQAIYPWAGADISGMFNFRAKQIILPISYRLPSAIKEVAEKVISRINTRIPKKFKARSGAIGSVNWIRDYADAPLQSGTWLLLARHHFQLRDAVEACQQLGVVYHYKGKWSNRSEELRAVIAYERMRRGDTLSITEAKLVASYIIGAKPPERIPGRDKYALEDINWPKNFPVNDPPTWMTALTRLTPDMREYIRMLRRNGEPITGEGRIQIRTIHGAKGWEEDNVVLCLDYSRRVERMMRRGEDDETRVFYVGITRAKENLYLIQPKTNRAFRI